MKLYVSSEHHFGRASDGAVYSLTGGREYSFWQRYLAVFDEVAVIARVGAVARTMDPVARADGPRVRFASLPEYQGLAQAARRAPAALRTILGLDGIKAAYLLRVPSLIGTLVWLQLVRTGQPYGLEVVADPGGVFAAGASRSAMRRLIAPLATLSLRRQCRRADAVSYVTHHTLQRSYPPHENAFATHFSSVAIPSDAYVEQYKAARTFDWKTSVPVIVTVGSLAQPYKGVDVLIDAVGICRDRGRPVTLRVVGDGRCRGALMRRADVTGVASLVSFQGHLPASGVRAELDNADLFVLASRTEGLPRALIEAMARGLPCIATNVGGIPEVLEREDLVPRDNPAALCDSMLEALSSRDRRDIMSERNHKAASAYLAHVLDPRRVDFYRKLRAIVEARQSQ